MRIKDSAKFAIGILDLICGTGLLVACVAMHKEQGLMYPIVPILCGIFSLFDSIETKKQQQKRREELRKFLSGGTLK